MIYGEDNNGMNKASSTSNSSSGSSIGNICNDAVSGTYSLNSDVKSISGNALPDIESAMVGLGASVESTTVEIQMPLALIDAKDPNSGANTTLNSDSNVAGGSVAENIGEISNIKRDEDMTIDIAGPVADATKSESSSVAVAGSILQREETTVAEGIKRKEVVHDSTKSIGCEDKSKGSTLNSISSPVLYSTVHYSTMHCNL